MGCYSEIGVIILLYFVVFVLNIVKTPKQMNCFGVLQRFLAACPLPPARSKHDFRIFAPALMFLHGSNTVS